MSRDTLANIFSSFCKKKFSPIRPRVQKIIGDKLVTDRQTDNKTTDRHFWADPHPYGKFWFFWGGRERIGGNLYLLARYPSSLRSLTLLAGEKNDFMKNMHVKPFSKTCSKLCAVQLWVLLKLLKDIEKGFAKKK